MVAYSYKAKKIVTVLSSSLETGVALNVLGHLALALGAHVNFNEIMGRQELFDASGIEHKGIARYPFIITKAKSSKINQLVRELRQRNDIVMVDYPKQMLETGHDDELAKALSKAPESTIEYLGFIIFGNTEDINKYTGKFSLWR